MHEHEVPCACLRAVENSALAILTLSQTLSWSTRLPRTLVTAFSLIPKTCGPMLSQEMTLNVPCPRGFPVRNFLRPPLIAAQHPPGRSLQRLMHRSWSLIWVSLHLLPPMVNIANVIPTTGSFLAILSQIIWGDFEHVKHVLSYMLITSNPISLIPRLRRYFTPKADGELKCSPEALKLWGTTEGCV